ncbi:uncharacterized, partial [Tachysurus ichikawai]
MPTTPPAGAARSASETETSSTCWTKKRGMLVFTNGDFHKAAQEQQHGTCETVRSCRRSKQKQLMRQ